MQKFFVANKVVYNYFLDKSIQYYKETGKSINYYDWCRDLTQIKKTEEFAWLNEVSNTSFQQTLKNLDFAYKNFFREIKKGNKKQGFPKFKSFVSSFRLSNVSCKYDRSKHKIRIEKVGWMKVVDYCPVFGKLMNMTIEQSKDGKWYVSICVEQEVKEYQNNSTSEIGIDVGIKDFAIDSEGNKIPNPRYYDKSQKKRTRLQRQLARKQKGSKNRNKARLKLAKFEAKVANQRANFLHQNSTSIVKNNRLVVHEDLNIRGMKKNKRLARQISDVSWGEFFRMLSYKGMWYNCKVVKINRFEPSSKRCNNCGYINKKLKLKDREWVCCECGVSLDRDINAAKNILELGLKSE